jgi:hypothetical protein
MINKKTGIGRILYIVALSYFFSLLFVVPLYNWQYAHNYGFARWLYFGEVIATAKAVVWPYYEIKARYSSEDKWEEHTELLAFLVTGSWTSMNDAKLAKKLPKMVAYEKKWLKRLPEDTREQLITAARAYAGAWVAWGKECGISGENILDVRSYELPAVLVYVNRFENIPGMKKAWDKNIQQHALRIEKLRKEMTKSGHGDSVDAQILKLLQPVVASLNQQGQSRMDDVIEELFSET